MAVSYCPGQNRRYWKPEDIISVTCSACGREVEIFKDEGRRRCPGCGIWLRNPRVAESCASWCSFAEDCLGVSLGEEDPSEELITTLSDKYELNQDESVALFKITQMVNERYSLDGQDPLLVKILAVLFAFSRLRSIRGFLPELSKILASCGIKQETAKEAMEGISRLTETDAENSREASSAEIIGSEGDGALESIISKVVENTGKKK
jgi:predicted RNA-binding Zn-ribbon protein involved in translation (DUF1610 family)